MAAPAKRTTNGPCAAGEHHHRRDGNTHADVGDRRPGMLAEREGFEPPIRLPVCRISSAVLSTTQPPLQRGHDLCQLLRSYQDISCSADGVRGWARVAVRAGEGSGTGEALSPRQPFATDFAAASARACAPGAVASPRVEPEPLWRPGVDMARVARRDRDEFLAATAWRRRTCARRTVARSENDDD